MTEGFNLTTSNEADLEFKPTIYDVKKILDIEIVGEETTKISLFTQWVLAEKNILMAGPRASGKTWITDHISKYFLGDNAYTISMGSAKAGWYQVEDIKKCSHIVIFELNQLPDDFMEVLKLWGEGKEATYKVVSTTNGVRNIQKYKLPPRPYTFCLADEEEMKVGEQLSSRLTVLRTDNSILQNKRVMKEQAKILQLRKVDHQIDEHTLGKIKTHIDTLPSNDELIYKHPAADEFVDAIPAFFTDSRRDFPKYLSNTFGITRFYWKDRIIKEIKGSKKVIFSTPQDMYMNHQIFWTSLVDSALKCSALERNMIDILKERGASMERAEIQKLLRLKGCNVSAHMITKHMNNMADIGYVEKVKDKQKTLYFIGDLFNDFKFNINWKRIVDICKATMLEQFPTFADEYIKRYCDNPTLQDVFTGNTINLNEIPFEEPKAPPKVEGLVGFDDVKPKTIPKVDTNIKPSTEKKGDDELDMLIEDMNDMDENL